MKKLSEIFHITYGNKFDLNKMTQASRSQGGVNFVGRSSQNHGVSGTVRPFPNVPPYEAGLITVALGGTKLLSSFVQEYPFYTAQNVAVLRPRKQMALPEKIFMCICIRHNRPRYSAFGREANRTIREIRILAPSEFPPWLRNIAVEDIERRNEPKRVAEIPALQAENWGWFKIGELFDLRKGKRLTKAHMLPGRTPFIGSIDANNGVSCYVGQKPIHEGGTITVNYNGSVAEAFYQPAPFWASDDVNVLYPKFAMTPANALFIVAIIRQEKYRFNYGRKWHLDRMKQSEIRLPQKRNHTPDWSAMQQYVETLPFSSQLESDR